MYLELPCLILMLFLGGAPLQAQRPPADPIGENLFPPDLIMRFQAELGLSDETRQAMMDDLQKAQPRFEQLNQQLQSEMAALAALLKNERVELEATLAQSDKMQKLEREQRHVQLTLMISLKNRLSPEQQAKLRTLRPKPGPNPADLGNMPAAIQGKMGKLQEGVQRWQEQGWDLAPLGKTVKKIEPLLRAGEFQEAEAILDDALKRLDEKRPTRE